MKKSPQSTVTEFINTVRSGHQPEATNLFMAPSVIANQVVSGEIKTIARTPQNHTDHIYEFLRCYGSYELVVEDVIAQNNRVYVRWRQHGRHLAGILGYEPTGKPLTTVGSAVYRVENEHIVEYWIQQENDGLRLQLENNLIEQQG